MDALIEAARQTAPWFSLDMCGDKLKSLENGFVSDAVYALAYSISTVHLEPEILEKVVTSRNKRNELRAECHSNSHIARLIDIFVTKDGTEMVRAKSLHNAYDKETLERAFLRAGVSGISRGVVAAEYNNAYIDIESMIPDTIYATEHHAWHRSVAPKRVPGLLEAAKAAGLLGKQEV